MAASYPPGSRYRVLTLRIRNCTLPGRDTASPVQPASEEPVAVRQGVGLGKDDVPVLGELAVLDAEKVIEHGRDAVQDSLALDEDELALGDDMVHSLHNGCPYADLNRMTETAHAVGDLGIVLDEAVAIEDSGDLRPVPAHHYQLAEPLDQLLAGCGLVWFRHRR